MADGDRHAAPREPWLRVVACAAAAFGVLTIYAGGSALFGGANTRAAAGAVVPFVLWFNFVAGFAYLVAGFGLWRQRRWAAALAILIAAATVLVFAGFGVHVLRDGAFEPRTVAAMTLRSLAWIAIAWFSARRLRRVGASAA